MMKKMLTAALLSLSLVGILFPASGTAAAEPFSDIAGHWAKANIESAVKAGFVSGYPDGTFKPDANVSRAEFLAIMTRASELSDAGAVEPFEDVASTHWAVDAINRGIGMGFIHTSDFGKTFAPDQALTRAEMVKWLVSGLAKADSSFVDALRDTRETILPFTEYFPGKFKESDIPYIAVSRGTGLVGGFPDGSFGPDRTTTRAEVVVLLERYLGVEGTKADTYRALNELREVGTTGTNLATIGNVAGELRWLNGFDRKESPVYTLFNKSLVVKRELGDVKVNRFIVIDPRMTSIYVNMFLDDQMKEFGMSRDVYQYFSEVTATFNRDVDSSTFAESISLAGSSVRHNLPKVYGYMAIHASEGNPMLKKGVTTRFWSSHTITYGLSMSITTSDNKTGGFVIEKE
ncbi:S-layer homology domain-containing protein [Paenibacillus antri]|uniref:S-layer homology domain-containing protein n=1 Tax=Paenibacillus antri TaxID=2582848 RepID=A0A5R9G8C8_9BACL|nr:S-layer homology domain-containing protein [Paenibacillus antri]TLS50616.1 S-layer homology domain-containing protein [Paenibacillus antri]